MTLPATPSGEPFFADRAALRRNFDRAAATFAKGDELHREVASRMLERFDVIKLAPRRILDAGAGTGGSSVGLRARFPAAGLFALDLSPAMLRAGTPRHSLWHRLRGAGPATRPLCGDMAALPFSSGAFDLVWSNLALHWLDDPLPAMREAGRTLGIGGLFMFSTLGPDTLKELRECFAQAGTGWHVKRFIDLHDLGDALGQAGFGAPVMDMEILTLTYATLDGLFADLRATGSTNAMAGRLRSLTGRSLVERVRTAYEGRRRDGRLPATFEVIYGHAWKLAPRRTTRGDAIVTFAPRRK